MMQASPQLSKGNSDNIKSGNDGNHPYEDGFLICTQLVKTGGADQGGLQVGDVFVEFGPFNKSHFMGLKSIAALVRRSARTPIHCVVWRKLETNGKTQDDTNGENDNNNNNNNDNNNNTDKINNSNTNSTETKKINETSRESVDDNGVKTIFQKLELKLTPLRSHDADGGGVLGSVINTWPLPEMKG